MNQKHLHDDARPEDPSRRVVALEALATIAHQEASKAAAAVGGRRRMALAAFLAGFAAGVGAVYGLM